MRVLFGAPEIENDFFQQRTQEFLTITIRGGRRRPDLPNIGAQSLNQLQLLRGQRRRPLLLPAAQLGFSRSQFAQTILPFCLETAGHQSVLWLHTYIAALGALRFITRAFHFQTPL